MAATATPTMTITAPPSTPVGPTSAPEPVASPPVPAGAEPKHNCLMCHSNPQFVGILENGQEVSLFVDKDHYGASVHGKKGLECVACHTNITAYPHGEVEQVTCLECHPAEGGNMQTKFATMRVKLPYADNRALGLPINEFCRPCHEKEFDSTTDSAHVKVLNSGNTEAPVCIDCHGSHDITPPDEPRSRISQTCAVCHEAVYSSYRGSVHGAALEQESNPDVPTCIDCHGVHSVRGPRDPSFRGDSIVICGRCHNDKELMEKYHISTDVFNSYLNDFHGRTVNLFREKGGLSSNKAVCFDCHGIHNIRPADDPLSSVYPDNLQQTCQQCHEEASIRFPQAWLSHYSPSWEQTPVLYAVNVVYQTLIPATLGGFMLYIGLDARKRWTDKRRYHARIKALVDEELDEDGFENDTK
ncbi:MAG: cytochrome c3 family protein [Chloroflexota bacterium]